MNTEDKDRKRAKRRSERARKVLQAAKLARRYNIEDERWIKSHADNLAACSCWMCGNPRKNGEVTFQEKKEKMKGLICDDV